MQLQLITNMIGVNILKYINGSRGSNIRNRLLESSIYINRITRPISTVDPKEIKHFSILKNDWWNENGPLRILHSFIPLRIQFVRDGLINTGIKIRNPALPLEGIKIVDVGCGGGILTESLAKTGAQVTGIDPSGELINVAKEHIKLDSNISKRVNYIQTITEDFSQKEEESHDAVVASEVLEHVADPQLFLKGCVKITKPGGSIFITTVNKTLISWLYAIVAAEYIFRAIPAGTHKWSKFIAPREVQCILDNYGCETKLIYGMNYNLLTGQWSRSSSTSTFYGLHAIKQKK